MLGRRALKESNGLHLIQPAQTHGINLPIDCFFRSLFKDLLNGVASFFKDAEAFLYYLKNLQANQQFCIGS